MRSTSSHKVGSRNERGTVFAELAIGCMIMIGIAMFALDIGTAMMCFGTNDRACRDAARAAAQGSNAAEANNLARRIVQNFNSQSNLVTSPQVVSVVYNDFNGTPPDGVSPFVLVTTRATARAVAPWGLGKTAIGGTFPLTKTYCFPIVKLTVKT